MIVLEFTEFLVSASLLSGLEVGDGVGMSAVEVPMFGMSISMMSVFGLSVFGT